MEQIELTIEGEKAFYHSITRIVTFCTKDGIIIESEMPNNKTLEEIFEFMKQVIVSHRSFKHAMPEGLDTEEKHKQYLKDIGYISKVEL